MHHCNIATQQVSDSNEIKLYVCTVTSASTEQAAAFVDKVIAYVSFRQADGTPLVSGWLKKMHFASANWGGRKGISASAVSPPPDNCFHYAAGSDHALIRLKDPFETLEWRLLTVVNDTDVRELPFARKAKNAGCGWHYAKSDTDLAPSEISVTIFGSTFRFPVPSNWVVVCGSAVELAPQRDGGSARLRWQLPVRLDRRRRR